MGARNKFNTERMVRLQLWEPLGNYGSTGPDVSIKTIKLYSIISLLSLSIGSICIDKNIHQHFMLQLNH